MRILIVFFLIVFSGSVRCQDRLIMMNGTVVSGKVTKVDSLHVKYTHFKHPDSHPVNLDRSRVFAIEYFNGQDVTLYKTDTTMGRWYSKEEMRLFVHGGQDARANYHNGMATLFSGCIGTAGGYVLGTNPLVVAVPVTMLAVQAFLPVNVKHYTARDKNLLREPAYVEGYKEPAKHRKAMNFLYGSIGGTVIGVVASLIMAPQ